VPLGYDADGRTLTINEPEAETVRQLFRLYLELGAVTAVEEEARRRGLTTKHYAAKTGRTIGGLRFSRGHLYKILSNPLYAGEIAHKERRYEGQHPAIIDRTIWDAVQAQLKSNTRERQIRSRAKQPSLLADLLIDEHGAKLTSTHAVKNGKRYRYYVSSQKEGAISPGWRLPAHEIEALVAREVAALMSDREKLCRFLEPLSMSADQLNAAFRSAEVLSAQLNSSVAEKRKALLEILQSVRLREAQLVFELRAEALVASRDPPERWLIKVPIAFQRRGEMRIMIPGGEDGSSADPALIKAIARGHAWFEELAAGRAATITEIARRENVSDRYISALLKLAFLSPALVEGSIRGKAGTLSAKRAITALDVPVLWSEQWVPLQNAATA
jgi:site-specific DNA recombinase